MTLVSYLCQRRTARRFLFIVLSILVLLSLVGVSAQEVAPDPHFSGENAFAHVADQVNIGFRQTATIGSYQAGNLILSQLAEFGWETAEDWHIVSMGDPATFDEEALQLLEDWQPVTLQDQLLMQVNQMAEGADGWQGVNVNRMFVPIRNLVATYGSPENGVIIIGAHYDSRIYADNDPDPANHRQPMPGANDGGSGVGVLLELARVLSTYYTPNVQIRLVFFDAEDNGRLPLWQDVEPSENGYIVGSWLYAQNLDLTSERILAMILVDLVGEANGQRFPQEGYSATYNAELNNQIWQVAADLGYGDVFPMEQRGAITDDHVPFLARGISAVDIIDLEYPHWHTLNDTLEQVSSMSLERVGRVVEVYLERAGYTTRLNQ